MAALTIMKSAATFPAAAVLALALSLNVAAQEKPQEPVIPVDPVELNGFGSDEPIARADEPTRGVLKVSPDDLQHMTAAHWEQYDCTKFTAKRWGKYEVRLTYTLRHANLGSQFRFGEKSLKKNLTATSLPKTMVYGEVYIEKPGTYPFVLYIAATGAESGLKIEHISFVPAPEGPTLEPAADGSLVLEAKSATTWSETMRYEPKAEKNCLGFWSNPDDFAEWSFDVAKPGRYKVAVVHGCASGNEGSQVAVKHDGQELKFTTQDTGGFQKWKEVSVGEIEIKKAGPQRLVIDPVNKVKTAVLDVHKVLLTPAG
jgi:hypothetical protein